MPQKQLDALDMPQERTLWHEKRGGRGGGPHGGRGAGLSQAGQRMLAHELGLGGAGRGPPAYGMARPGMGGFGGPGHRAGMMGGLGVRPPPRMVPAGPYGAGRGGPMGVQAMRAQMQPGGRPPMGMYGGRGVAGMAPRPGFGAPRPHPPGVGYGAMQPGVGMRPPGGRQTFAQMAGRGVAPVQGAIPAQFARLVGRTLALASLTTWHGFTLALPSAPIALPACPCLAACAAKGPHRVLAPLVAAVPSYAVTRPDRKLMCLFDRALVCRRTRPSQTPRCRRGEASRRAWQGTWSDRGWGQSLRRAAAGPQIEGPQEAGLEGHWASVAAG